jgi:ZIP family zinc transporter
MDLADRGGGLGWLGWVPRWWLISKIEAPSTQSATMLVDDGRRRVVESFLWGLLGGAFLLVGAWWAYRFNPSRVLIAAVMAIGSGVLFGAVAYELIDEALKTQSVGRVGIFVLLGACTFALGDWIISRRGGGERKDPSGKQSSGSPLAIVFGSILDGIPESFVLGLTVLQGAVSIPLLAGIALSNLPEGIASSSGLKVAGWAPRRAYRMWSAVALASGVSAAAGYLILDPASGLTGALVQAFAGGALMAMVADELLPEAYEVEGVVTGVLLVVGFAISLLLDNL